MNKLVKIGLICVAAAPLSWAVSKQLMPPPKDRAAMMGQACAQLTILIAGVVMIVVGLLRGRRT